MTVFSCDDPEMGIIDVNINQIQVVGSVREIMVKNIKKYIFSVWCGSKKFDGIYTTLQLATKAHSDLLKEMGK